MSNKDYQSITVAEAAELEIMQQFLDAVKHLDTKVSARRLVALMNQYGHGKEFLSVTSKFTALKDVITSADR
jgi:hypothetical protein